MGKVDKEELFPRFRKCISCKKVFPQDDVILFEESEYGSSFGWYLNKSYFVCRDCYGKVYGIKIIGENKKCHQQ